jgi:hypothetical protein
MKTTLQVPKNYQNQPCSINFEGFETKIANLDDFKNELKVISTSQKWSTWGRTYIEIPPSVLINFGIVSTTPLVAYINYVYNNPYFYCYTGEVFSGDAAWFDNYEEVESSKITATETYKRLKIALEDKSKDFINHFNQQEQKWKIVPIANKEMADFARNLNKHIK